MELRWCGRLPLKQYGFFRGVCPEARGIYAPRCSSQSGGWFFRLDYRIKGCFAVFRKAVCRYGHNPWKNRESLSLAVLSYRFAKGFAQIIRKSFVKAGYYYGRVWNAWQGDWKNRMYTMYAKNPHCALFMFYLSVRRTNHMRRHF